MPKLAKLSSKGKIASKLLLTGGIRCLIFKEYFTLCQGVKKELCLLNAEWNLADMYLGSAYCSDHF